MSDDEQRFFLIDADSDDRASLYYGDSWRCVDTMPDTGHIECLTVTGLIRHAEAQRSREAIRPSDAKGPRRLRVNGVQAIAWRPWDYRSKNGAER